MNRRAFIGSGLSALAFAACSPRVGMRDQAGTILTVTGPIAANRLGTTLPHEHVLVDFAGADRVSPDRYDVDEAFTAVLPHLQQARSLGAATLFECTPAYLGRDPRLLRRLSEATGLQIVTNTGLYGARQDQHIPRFAFEETADQLAARWTREFRDGIDGTGIRPGFMKIGVDAPLAGIDEKLIRAAARTHLRTGLTMAVHSGPSVAAFRALEILAEEGVHPSAWIWVHAQAEQDPDAHARAAQTDGWVSFDGLSPESVDEHVRLVLNMKRYGRLGRVLVSHDAGWYHVGEPGGGTFRPFDTLFTSFIPALRDAGLTAEDVQVLTVRNPAAAFGLRIRRVAGQR